jgi:hypothetical protein
MNGHVQNSYDGQHGTMYTFVCVLEDGTTGQVSSKTPAPHRFGPGDDVEYSFTPAANAKHMGRLKIEKPKDEVPANGAPNEPQRGSGWSPAKEASVMIQGLLKSIVESGAPKENWADMLSIAIKTHDTFLRQRIAAKAGQPAPQPVAAPAVTQDPPAAYAKPVQPALADMPEDDLPF